MNLKHLWCSLLHACMFTYVRTNLGQQPCIILWGYLIRMNPYYILCMKQLLAFFNRNVWMLTVGSNIDFFFSLCDYWCTWGEKCTHFLAIFFLHFWVIVIYYYYYYCCCYDYMPCQGFVCALMLVSFIIKKFSTHFLLCIIIHHVHATLYCTALSPHFEKMIVNISFNIAFFCVCMYVML